LKDFLHSLLRAESADRAEGLILRAVEHVLDESYLETEILETLSRRADERLGWADREHLVQLKRLAMHPGVLLHEEELALTSGSALGEALLGEADALDPYALALQATDADSKALDNALQGVEVDALMNIADAKTRAETYAAAFGPDGKLKIDLDQSP